MNKEYVISDLHGRYDLLKLALDAIHNDSTTGTIVFTGDYIDRGEQNREILEFLMEPAPDGWEHIILKGNHDEMMEKCDIKSYGDCWIVNGGLKTYAQYPAGDTAFIEHRKFISTMKLYHETEHRIYVHAYVNPRTDLKDHTSQDLLWTRYVKGESGGYRGKFVVHGHTPVDTPVITDGRANFDTGAVFTGLLSVGVFDAEKAGGPIDIMRIKL